MAIPGTGFSIGKTQRRQVEPCQVVHNDDSSEEEDSLGPTPKTSDLDPGTAPFEPHVLTSDEELPAEGVPELQNEGEDGIPADTQEDVQAVLGPGNDQLPDLTKADPTVITNEERPSRQRHPPQVFGYSNLGVPDPRCMDPRVNALHPAAVPYPYAQLGWQNATHGPVNRFSPPWHNPYLQPLAPLPPAWNFPQYTQRDSWGYPMKGH